MKIYDKKKFAFGVMYLLLGICLLTFGFLKGFDAPEVILSILMPLIGISEMYLSTNKEAVRQERIEGTDERNHLIALTSASKAFNVAKKINFILMLSFLIIGAKLDKQLPMGVGLGFAFAFSIMRFLDLFSTIYYERHM